MSGKSSESESESESDSSSCESLSLSDLERPENYYEETLGAETLERLRAWLPTVCQRFLILHQDRERRRSPSFAALDRSWKSLQDEMRRVFGEALPESFIASRSDWGVLGLWEDEVYRPWMLVRDEFREAARTMSDADAEALARIYYLVAMADCNMTEFVCDVLQRKGSNVTPSGILSAVERAASRRGQLDTFTAAFNMPAADDLARHLVREAAAAAQ